MKNTKKNFFLFCLASLFLASFITVDTGTGAVNDDCHSNTEYGIIECGDYDISGSEYQQTIILVHGTRVARKMWLPQLVGLGDVFRVVAPDLPGHGSLCDQSFTLTASVEQIRRVIDEIDAEKVLVVGISLGGYIVSEFACTYPEKTTGAVIAGASATPMGILTIPHRILGLLTRIVSTDWMIEHDMKKWREHYPPEIVEPIIEGGFYHDAVYDVINEIAGKDYLEKLVEYKKPVLILNGENDIAFGKDEELYHERIEGSKLVIIEGIGHVTNLEAPEEFNRHLRAFADSLAWE
jgi:pimeloyl-ACP methyl ester carboxylesterase